MTRKQNNFAAVLLVLTLLSTAVQAQAQDSSIMRSPMNQVPSGSQMTLLQIEELAVQSNPTLAQAAFSIPAAEGRRRQAGLLPNPVAGGEVQNFAFRNLGISPAYLGFAVQTIPLGGKLGKMRKIYNVEVSQAELEASMQRQRVLNTIRNVFYNVLGAQQTVDLQTELAVIARDATTTTSELFNVGQADKPDIWNQKSEKTK